MIRQFLRAKLRCIAQPKSKTASSKLPRLLRGETAVPERHFVLTPATDYLSSSTSTTITSIGRSPTLMSLCIGIGKIGR
jgi:hypothetical protein